ncbi:MAG TPA: hypothetical protein VHN17_02405 [Steroidobacteraceae bacterium]|jgi:hypothetical protein|nr:hypothetical protein [Steroidobacteraceae bacterium]
MYERYSHAKPAERKELDASTLTFVRVRSGSTADIVREVPHAHNASAEPAQTAMRIAFIDLSFRLLSHA